MHLDGTPIGVEHRHEQLDALYTEAAPYEEYGQEHVHVPCQLSETEILEKARNARSGPKFIRLYDRGDISDYNSPSEADLALCRMLVLVIGNDVSMIDRLFRRSGLNRDWKWDRNAGAGITYGERTIRRALWPE